MKELRDIFRYILLGGLTLCAGLMMLSCSGAGDDKNSSVDTSSLTPSYQHPALCFDVYTQRNTTRGGLTGTMTDTQLRCGAAEGGGFGVFAYYTDNKDYRHQTLPNLMYNQSVYWSPSASVWEYAPVKYWPNEYGSHAVSDDSDKVSFFAYAPYVSTDPATGRLTGTVDSRRWGITSMSENTAVGDPFVRYAASFEPDQQVDLLWGVCGQPHWNTVEGGVQKVNSGRSGLPWLNVERPSQIAQNLQFLFRHATSQLSVTVDSYTDGMSSADVDSQTKIYVRSVTFMGFALKGALSLNNVKADQPRWLEYDCSCSGLVTGDEVTVYDGRQNGREGMPLADATPTEKLQGLNPDLIQTVPYGDPSLAPGVTATARPLFRTGTMNVIPTGDEVMVEIEYDVETRSDNLGTLLADCQTYGTSIQNRIRKTVSFGPATTFEAGHRYELRLHLGMNSVKFDACVADWLDEPQQVFPMPAAEAPKVGDLYFSDGTWGSYDQNQEKIPIGIVFSTNTSAKDKTLGFNNGYVMSLRNVKDASGKNLSVAWANTSVSNLATSTSVIDAAGRIAWVGNVNGQKAAMADIDGLTHCLTARERAAAASDYTLADLPAINTAFEYSHQVAPPYLSSGWYLPSIGQMYLWFESFSKGAGVYSTYFPGSSKDWGSHNNYAHYIASGPHSQQIITQMNNTILGYLGSDANKSLYDPINVTGTYSAEFWWSSSISGSNPWFLQHHASNASVPGRLHLWNNNARSTQMMIRPVLAF